MEIYFFILDLVKQANMETHTHQHTPTMHNNTTHMSSTTSHSDVQCTESLWTIRHYVMRPTMLTQMLDGKKVTNLRAIQRPDDPNYSFPHTHTEFCAYFKVTPLY